MAFTFETNGNNSFLVYGIEPEDTLDTMTLGMITNNKIPGMASVVYTQMNADRFLKYNITAKVTVKQFFAGVVNRRRLLGVFSGITAAVSVAEEYMIDLNSFLLDTDFIYADVSTCNAEVICLPVMNVAGTTDVGMFFKNIMFTTQFDQTENCDYVAKIINYLNSAPVFVANDFGQLLEQLYAEASGPVYYQQMPSVQPQMQVQQPASAKKAFFGKKVETISPQPEQAVQQISSQQQGEKTDHAGFAGGAQGGGFAVPNQNGGNGFPGAGGASGFGQNGGGFAVPGQNGGNGFPGAGGVQASGQNGKGFAVPGQKETGGGFAIPGQKDGGGFAVPGQQNGGGFGVPGQNEAGGFGVPGQNSEGRGQAGQEAGAGQKKMSMFYLLQHYNKENAAAYKAQQEEKKNSGKADKGGKKGKSPKGGPGMPGQNGGAGFQVPGQNGGAGFQVPGQNGGVGSQAAGQNKGAGFQMPGQNKGAGFQVPGQNGGAGFQAAGQNKGAGFQMPGQNKGAGFPMPGQNGGAGLQASDQKKGAGFQVPGQNGGPGFAMPGQNNAGGIPVSGQQFGMGQPVPGNPQQMSMGDNFGDTVIMGADDFGDETMVLGAVQAAAAVKPYLLRSSNNEKILLEKAVFHIGKERSYVDYCISGNPTISRSHADIINKNGQFYIVDNNSTNHTYVNGEMIPSNTEIPLSHGAKIRLSNEEFEFKTY